MEGDAMSDAQDRVRAARALDRLHIDTVGFPPEPKHRDEPNDEDGPIEDEYEDGAGRE
jgi:hypothetical protein